MTTPAVRLKDSPGGSTVLSLTDPLAPNEIDFSFGNDIQSDAIPGQVNPEASDDLMRSKTITLKLIFFQNGGGGTSLNTFMTSLDNIQSGGSMASPAAKLYSLEVDFPKLDGTVETRTRNVVVGPFSVRMLNGVNLEVTLSFTEADSVFEV